MFQKRDQRQPTIGVGFGDPLLVLKTVPFSERSGDNRKERPNCPGSIVFEPPNLCLSSHLWDGLFTAKFQMPYNAQIGDTLTMHVTVSDIERDAKGEPFVSRFTLVGVSETEDVPPTPGPRRQGSKPNANGKHVTPAYAPPDIREVRRPKWDDPQFKFDEYTALKIVNADEGKGFIFFVNMDNQFLIHELHKAKDEEGGLVKHWFKYGIVLSALGILKELQRAKQAGRNGGQDGENGEEEIDLQDVSRFCAGLARVVVPMIRALHKGPTALATVAAAV